MVKLSGRPPRTVFTPKARCLAGPSDGVELLTVDEAYRVMG